MLPDCDPYALPVTALRGIGEARAKHLERLGLRTLGDLMLYLPRTYARFVSCSTLAEALAKSDGEGVLIRGQVHTTSVQRSRGRRHIAVEAAELRDATGSIEARWFVPFRGPVPRPRCSRGSTVALRGTLGTYGRTRTLMNAEVVTPDRPIAEEILPVYALTHGISQRLMRSMFQAGLEKLRSRGSDVPDLACTDLSPVDSMDEVELDRAFWCIHAPSTLEMAEYGRRLLAWREVSWLRHQQIAVERGPELETPWPNADGDRIRIFVERLPFEPTSAQQRVMEEIRLDMAQRHGMRRMLCGDVGSGKSLIIAYALLKAVEAGGQGLLVVPTRILAAQHMGTLTSFYAGLGIRLGLLTAELTHDQQRAVVAGVRDGSIDILVATHSAFEPDVEYRRLLVGVIDEQHRFGVRQRLALERKAPVHTLWVSATPIPKSMAQIVYGGIPVSYLDERPPGRHQVETRWVSGQKREAVYEFLSKEVAAGGRAFVVCPYIEEDPEAGIPGAVQTWELLKRLRPGGHAVALIHGRLRPDEQEEALEAFVTGKARTIVATSMVEVGVDVPEASLMIIEGAERFGLAQLHQLRGRVGRGQRQSYAILVSDAQTELAKERLQALRMVHDGFQLAEADLELRGPGEFIGMRQSGLPDLRFADLTRDRDLFQKAATQSLSRGDVGRGVSCGSSPAN